MGPMASQLCRRLRARLHGYDQWRLRRTGRSGGGLAYLCPGDTLVVWRLDRLGRSLQHLIATISALRAQGVGFKSLTEQIDTTTPSGKLVWHVFGALAGFERDLDRERSRRAART